MTALEEERTECMKETPENVVAGFWGPQVNAQPAEDEGIVRRVLNKVELSGEFSVIDVERIALSVFLYAHALLCVMIRSMAAVWVTKKGRIQAASPYGCFAVWDVVKATV
jgi:hypothetical protein